MVTMAMGVCVRKSGSLGFEEYPSVVSLNHDNRERSEGKAVVVNLEDQQEDEKRGRERAISGAKEWKRDFNRRVCCVCACVCACV